MAQLLRSEMRSLMRFYAGDSDATDPAASDAQCNSLLTDAAEDFLSMYPEENQYEAGTVSFAAGVEWASFSTTGATLFRYLTRAEIRDTSGTTRGRNLERLKVPEIRSMQEFETAQGTAIYWAAEPVGSHSLWTIHIHPRPSGTTVLSIWGTAYPTAMNSDSDGLPIGDEAVRLIVRMAAVRLAGAIGQPVDYIQNIARDLASGMQAYDRYRMGVTRPRPSNPIEEAV